LEQTHPGAIDHLPVFVTAPGQTDVLFVVTVVLLIGIVLGIGLLYLHLHALPERVAHRTNKVQMEIVAILALLALFTHEHLFWIAALLLAFVQLPDFSTPVASMAESLEKLARRGDGLRGEPVEDRPRGEPEPQPQLDRRGEVREAGQGAAVREPVAASRPVADRVTSAE
jgi:hypothetical protein